MEVYPQRQVTAPPSPAPHPRHRQRNCHSSASRLLDRIYVPLQPNNRLEPPRRVVPPQHHRPQKPTQQTENHLPNRRPHNLHKITLHIPFSSSRNPIRGPKSYSSAYPPPEYLRLRGSPDTYQASVAGTKWWECAIGAVWNDGGWDGD